MAHATSAGCSTPWRTRALGSTLLWRADVTRFKKGSKNIISAELIKRYQANERYHFNNGQTNKNIISAELIKRYQANERYHFNNGQTSKNIISAELIKRYQANERYHFNNGQTSFLFHSFFSVMTVMIKNVLYPDKWMVNEETETQKCFRFWSGELMRLLSELLFYCEISLGFFPSFQRITASY